VIVHEAVKTCGAGAEIAQSAMEGAFDYLQAPITRVTSSDLPIPTGSLQDVVYPSEQDVIDAVHAVMQ
jgi:pyruvate dehydrogenase E1 component beta subunit